MKKPIGILAMITVSLFGAYLALAGETHRYSHDSSHHGMISVKSAHSVKDTMDRLEAALRKKGITIVTRWSHSDHAHAVGISLRPTELLLFGNPRLGSRMFTSKQTAGIDLPMKALAWEDEKGQVWLTYNDPAYIAMRHGITDRPKVVAKMTGALKTFTNIATRP